MGMLIDFAGVGTEPGTQESIELHVWPAWPSFGRGRFLQLDPYQASFSGEVDIPLVYRGPVNVSFDLTDRDPTSAIGPCKITVNGRTDYNATYQVEGSKLVFNATIDGKSRTLVMYRTGSEKECTMVEVKGAKSNTLRLRPVR